MPAAVSQQAGRFIIVGTIGFFVDGGILTVLHNIFDFSLLYARFVSFSGAVTITWYLNRRHTFADRKDAHAVHEWGRYAVVNGFGALLNLGIFFWLIYSFDILATWPIIPLAVAASIALIFNFFASRNLAFRRN